MMRRIRPNQILTVDEIRRVLRREPRTSRQEHTRMIFILSVGCGLRRKEIAGLEIQDVMFDDLYPSLRVRPETSKANHKGVRRGRFVPLWWDERIGREIEKWARFRAQRPHLPFVLSYDGRRLSCDVIARRFKTALRSGGLSPTRVAQLSVHSGRHSFCSHALRAGHSVAEVRDAAGHSNIAVTDMYMTAIPARCPDMYS